MPTNNPTIQPSVRAPRLQVLFEGKPLPGAFEARWMQTNHYAPDTFDVSFAVNADPSRGPAWWDNRTAPMVLDIQAGLAQPNGAVQWTSLGIGQVDSHEYFPAAGTIELTGRDLSALLTDNETAETFQNQTSAQIVEAIAARNGLTADTTATKTVPYPAAPVAAPAASAASIAAAKAQADEAAQAVAAATALAAIAPSDEANATLNRAIARATAARERVYALAKPVGRFYGADNTVTTFAQQGVTKEWDLLVKLARIEGFDLYVTGTTLHFHPVVDLGSDPYVIRFDPATAAMRSPVSNALELNMTRRFAIAKGVTVIVKSFHSKAGKTVTATVSRGGAMSGGNIGANVYTQTRRPQRYTFVRPNLTQAQADALAKSMLDDITRHERTISWQGPADMILTARSVVRVEGTGTGFDANYFADHVTRTIKFDGGFYMEATAKNHSPEAAAAAEA